MATLSRELRKTLERVVAEAREVAEEAAEKALKGLAVGEAKPHASMTAEQKSLRNRLSAHGRQLGDARNMEKGTQQLDHLIAECACEHWHRMLFARFLAENHLLIEPETGVSTTIEEVKELARGRGADWVALAGEFAVRMLPQVFRQDDPVLEVSFAPEDRKALEELLESLAVEVFTADDSLGWTYQFWQAEAKGTINASGKKIGADELGPVTQLFTEDYMVEFLLHNTLGAWWAGKVLARRPELAASGASEDELREVCAVGGVRWTYLRFEREDGKPWRPAAGAFGGWPRAARDITVLDPCMGSGHFLVFALPIIAALRAAEEGLAPKDAVLAVLRDNLFGLELDARCTQIAAFNLALAAWKVTGFEPIGALQLACSGMAPNVQEKEWTALSGKDERLRTGMARLHALFKNAPVLGSLINPRADKGDLLEAEFHELQPLLEKALAQQTKDETAHEMAVTARGLAKAAEILAGQFTLVVTNVPYLGRGKQDDVLKEYCQREHARAKTDLATCFLERCMSYCAPQGTSATVSPLNWLFLSRFAPLRRELLTTATWSILARLGPRAFESIAGEVVSVTLTVMSRAVLRDGWTLSGIDAELAPGPAEKAIALAWGGGIARRTDRDFLDHDDAVISLSVRGAGSSIGSVADTWQGLVTCDDSRYIVRFWEIERAGDLWRPMQLPPQRTEAFAAKCAYIRWEGGRGALHHDSTAHNFPPAEALERPAIAMRRTGELNATLMHGEVFGDAVAPIFPARADLLPAIWCFAESGEFGASVRVIDKQIKTAVGSFLRVQFDEVRWRAAAARRYPDGLPRPHSLDASQWLFRGHPHGSLQPLHVALTRLLAYRWPRQTGSGFPDCSPLGLDGLESHADPDGIVCLTALKGEEPAGARLRNLLAAAFGNEWSAAKQAELVAEAVFEGDSLDDWLKSECFEQHCDLFHQRPFVWHIWDGEPDGFHALVNYHRLAAPDGEGRKTLEKLAYAYLGDWIGRQKAEQKHGKEGADAKLAAAVHLQGQLKSILDGNPPYDLFVRWKPLHEQAIGWVPDINDGVRMNIRPFMMAETLKGKSIFRKAPKIKWDKDRGKEPKRPKRDFPWFWGWDEEETDFKGGPDFDGNRWNDLHYSIAMKNEARARHKEKGR